MTDAPFHSADYPSITIPAYAVTLEARVAVLENKVTNVADDVKAVREAIEKMSDDISALTQITALGRMVWKAIVWAGVFVSGLVAFVYMLLSIKASIISGPSIQDIPRQVLQHLYTPPVQ